MGSMSNGVLLFGAAVILVVLCAAVGLNAWLRVRRIDRTESAQAAQATPAAEPAEPAATGPAESAADLPEDPDYQGPGDWDGGPADPPGYRTPPG